MCMFWFFEGEAKAAEKESAGREWKRRQRLEERKEKEGKGEKWESSVSWFVDPFQERGTNVANSHARGL